MLTQRRRLPGLTAISCSGPSVALRLGTVVAASSTTDIAAADAAAAIDFLASCPRTAVSPFNAGRCLLRKRFMKGSISSAKPSTVPRDRGLSIGRTLLLRPSPFRIPNVVYIYDERRRDVRWDAPMRSYVSVVLVTAVESVGMSPGTSGSHPT